MTQTCTEERPCEDPAEGCYLPNKERHRNQSCWHLDLSLPPSRIVRKKNFCCSNHSVCGTLLWQPCYTLHNSSGGETAMQVRHLWKEKEKKGDLGRKSLILQCSPKKVSDRSMGIQECRLPVREAPHLPGVSGSTDSKGVAAGSHQLITLLAGGSLQKGDLSVMPPKQPQWTYFENAKESCCSCCSDYYYSPWYRCCYNYHYWAQICSFTK